MVLSNSLFEKCDVKRTKSNEKERKGSNGNQLCTRNLCPGRGDAAGGTRKRENGENGGNAKRENGKKRKRENGENAKTAKTRNRAKQESRFCSKQKNITINYRTSNQTKTHGDGKSTKKMEMRKLENGKKCSRVLVVCFCTEAVHSAAL